MNPIARYIDELTERGNRRAILHLRFGSAMRANGFQPPRWSAEPEPVSRLRPDGRPSLSQERG
jgi:hypothetical protein